jgi:gluconokinase
MASNARESRRALFIVVMGVAGAGKSTVGRKLAAALGWPFYEADELHPPANVERMRRGEPLTDADREPWLAKLERLIHTLVAKGTSAVLACSALRETYRARLRSAGGEGRVEFVYLRLDPPLASQRLRERRGHFMSPSLVESQFAILEEPVNAITVDASRPPEVLSQEIRVALHLPAGPTEGEATPST